MSLFDEFEDGPMFPRSWATRLKVAGAVVCALITAALALYLVQYRLDNPALTETQLFLDNGWIEMPMLLAGFVGLILWRSALDDEEDV